MRIRQTLTFVCFVLLVGVVPAGAKEWRGPLSNEINLRGCQTDAERINLYLPKETYDLGTEKVTITFLDISLFPSVSEVVDSSCRDCSPD